ncbi:hypothetical protein GCM10009827_078230 [Dactylosporangium maewongense]|uniref:PE-PGRS family protein n=1 Tax=Dactylosporangium maewongense TaxID=634393 RepID=A0ABP4MLH3_9ACTN
MKPGKLPGGPGGAFGGVRAGSGGAGGANGPAGGNGPGLGCCSASSTAPWPVAAGTAGGAAAGATGGAAGAGSEEAAGEPYVAGAGGAAGDDGWTGGLVGIGTDAVARTVPAGGVPGGGELGALAALSSASDGWGWSDVIVPPVGQTLATVVDPNRTWQSGGSGSPASAPRIGEQSDAAPVRGGSDQGGRRGVVRRLNFG